MIRDLLNILASVVMLTGVTAILLTLVMYVSGSLTLDFAYRICQPFAAFIVVGVVLWVLSKIRIKRVR